MFVKVPYSKNVVRQVVSDILEKPIFESLHRIENHGSNLDMQTYLEVQTLLKHESRESNIAERSWREMIPQAVVDTLTRQKEITAFGIWQDKFFVFLKRLSSVDVQSEINSMLREADDVFFNKMTPTYFYTDDFLVTKYIRQGDALYRRNDNVGMIQGATASFRGKTGTVGALLRNTLSKEKVYGLTSRHLLPKTNIPAFTKREGILDPCANCILSFDIPDMAFIEFENKSINLCVTAFHDETDKPRRTKVYHDSLSNVGMVHKKGAISNWTEGMIISPETHARIAQGGYLKRCIFVEGTSGHFSSPGDSGSVIFAHSPDHSHLQALGIVTAGKLKIRDPKWLERIGRTESDLEKMTIAFRLQPGFDKARESKPSFNFKFEDVKSSSSESDED